MDRPQLKHHAPILFVALLAISLGSYGVATAVDAPEVDPEELTVISQGGRVSFSMHGTDLGLFRTIRLVSEDDVEGPEGMRIAMGRAQGERRNASIRTSGAEPGLYFVELVDLRGGVVRLDLEVTVEEYEPPEAPRARPGFVTVPSVSGRANFVLNGPDVGQFTGIRLEGDEEETGGVQMRLSRVAGRNRRGYVTTDDATPGIYSVALLDAQGTVVPLRMRVRVFELTAPAAEPEQIQLTDDEDSAAFEMKGLGLSLFEEIRLVDDGGSDEVAGLSIAMDDRVTRNRREATVSIDGEAVSGVYRVEVLDRDGETYELDVEIEVEVEPPEDDWVSDTAGDDSDDWSTGGNGASFGDDVDQKVVAKAFTVEIDGNFVPVVSFSGGDLQAEEADASSGSSQHNESTMGHNYITDLTLEVFFTPDSHAIPELVMGWIQESGEPVDVAITELAKDKSVVKTYVYSDCVPVSYVPPRVAANASGMLKHQLTLKPARLEVSSAEPNPEEYFAPAARDLLYSFLEALVPNAEAAQTESDQLIFSKYFELEVVGIYQKVPGAVSVLPGTVYWSIEEATRGDRPDMREYIGSFDRFDDWTIEVMQGPDMMNLQKYVDDALKGGAHSRTFSVRFLARDKSTVLGSMHALGTPIEVIASDNLGSQVKRIQFTIEVENLSFDEAD